jgi:hypothetical protein
MGRTSHAVFPEQGHYANDPEVLASYPPAENQLDQVSDLLNYEQSALLKRLRREAPAFVCVSTNALTSGRGLQLVNPGGAFRAAFRIRIAVTIRVALGNRFQNLDSSVPMMEPAKDRMRNYVSERLFSPGFDNVARNE